MAALVSHDIVIVGGGICGLATALALHGKGIPSLVLEKSETLRVEGGSIGVHVNGWRVLEQLGIAAELRETANPITAFHDVWLEEEKSTLTPIRGDVCATRQSVLEKLQGQQCPAEILEMVQNSDSESLNVVTKVWYRLPWQIAFASFRKGTVTVAGDAMHVMGSYIGQGGSASLEDALVLARSLACGGGGRSGVHVDDKTMIIGAVTARSTATATAIGKYVRERRLRVTRLSLEAFLMGTLLRAKSLATKLTCLPILALMGIKALGHTNYDCGRL